MTVHDPRKLLALVAKMSLGAAQTFLHSCQCVFLQQCCAER